jgi:hypothetical protein
MLFLIQIPIPRLDMPKPPQLGLPGRKGRRWRKWRAESTVSVSPNPWVLPILNPFCS